MGAMGVSLLLLCAFAALRLCEAQNGVCYVTASQVLTQSKYVATSYTYYYDCSNLGWGWSYCATTGYISTLVYFSSTAYVAQFTCCAGYSQVGTTQTCADINECSPNGGLGPCQQICTNTAGSYYCSCQPGYTLSENFCNDINECSSNGGLGPCQQVCTNTIGSYSCNCPPGYALSVDGTNCIDSNECAPNGGLGPCQQNCTNTNGSFICGCLKGYALSADRRTCQVSSQIVNPTVTSEVIVTSLSVTQSPPKNVYVQLRLLDVADCTTWTIPTALKALDQTIEDNVNDYCICNITITNAYVICYDATRVTIRGIVDEMKLEYLKDWVIKVASTISPLGTTLKVDKGCAVQIQSFDDSECITAVSAQKAVGNSIGLSVGLAVSSLVIVCVLIGIVVIIVMLIKVKKLSCSRTINPLYHTSEASTTGRNDENPYDSVDDCVQIVRDKQNIQSVEYYNAKKI